MEAGEYADLNAKAWKMGNETMRSANEIAESLKLPFTFQDPEDFVPDFNYELLVENARLRKALEFYADPKNYALTRYSGVRRASAVENDKGKVALKELGWNK